MAAVYVSRRRPPSISIVGGFYTRRSPYWIALDRIDTEEKLAEWLGHLRHKTWWTAQHASELTRIARENMPHAARPTGRGR